MKFERNSKARVRGAEKEAPFRFEMKDEIGALRAVAGEEGGEFSITLENTNGEIFEMDSLLPSEYSFVNREKKQQEDPNDDRSEYVDYERREIAIRPSALKKEKWKYLLTILHEVGHARRREEAEEEGKELDLLGERLPNILGEGSSEQLSRFMTLQSKDERDAWAYAIRQFRNLRENFNLKLARVFPDLASLKAYVEECLREGYKRKYHGIIRETYTDEPERKVKTELLDVLSGLFVKDTKRRPE